DRHRVREVGDTRADRLPARCDRGRHLRRGALRDPRLGRRRATHRRRAHQPHHHCRGAALAAPEDRGQRRLSHLDRGQPEHRAGDRVPRRRRRRQRGRLPRHRHARGERNSRGVRGQTGSALAARSTVDPRAWKHASGAEDCSMILQDKTVLVAGVGAGLGRHVVEAALRDGANVLLAARTEAVLEQTAKEVDPSGKRVAWRRTDISDAADCAALVAHGVERFGKVDALVQVAAYELAFGGLHDTDFDNWRRCFETNVLGTLTLLRAVHPAMKRAGGGSIVLIGSQSMFLPSLPQAGYAASKGALLTAMYYL